MPEEFWKTVIYTDETRIAIRNDRKIEEWRTVGENGESSENGESMFQRQQSILTQFCFVMQCHIEVSVDFVSWRQEKHATLHGTLNIERANMTFSRNFPKMKVCFPV